MKKPWLAVVLSIIYPGIGHLYLGHVRKGVILIILEFISILLASVIIGLIIYPIIWIYGIANAYHLSTRQVTVLE
ncbi:sugar ABC transporter permease [Paenibacillus alba]|uniref:Sugar ABC transporter permease n=1 Tax=Paenibacillus alba TaxID=1197127 RepID=A0ABU6G7P9_9BACL|nr:sugar ABC transporter permease [Paenibacillus alba]MEC0228868.1 sugar ABC transporter permease [Paenibacillus alba]